MVTATGFFSTVPSIDLLVGRLMAAERQPLERLRAQQSGLATRAAVLTDLKGLLASLESVVRELAKSDATSVFRSRSVTSSDTSKVSATVDASASSASYAIEVTQLAKAHRVASARQSSSTASLGLSGTVQVNGVQVVINAGNDSLEGIRDAINGAAYAQGQEVVATIVDNTLVLERATTGAGNTIAAPDVSGDVLQALGVLDGTGAFANELQAAQDAVFTVNGLGVTSPKNSGISHAIGGVTLDLKGETTAPVTLTVSTDTTAITGKVRSFLTALNNVGSYLRSKTRAADSGLGLDRGPLAGDPVFAGLRLALLAEVTGQVDGLGPGSPSYLTDLGVTFGKDLQVTLTDSTRLEQLLRDTPAQVAAVFNSADGIATRLVALLEPYTATSGIVDDTVEAVHGQQNTLDGRIRQAEERLRHRQEYLRSQLMAMQETLSLLQQQQWYVSSLVNFVGSQAPAFPGLP